MYPRWELERFLRETSESLSLELKRKSEPRVIGEILDDLGNSSKRSRGVPKARAASRPGSRKNSVPQGSLSTDGKGGGLVCQPDSETALGGREAR